jgi:hypothetical protein
VIVSSALRVAPASCDWLRDLVNTQSFLITLENAKRSGSQVLPVQIDTDFVHTELRKSHSRQR